ncbi:DNA-binding protein [Photobacterium aquae]|uniref:DNA-binding protein n=1 Tax=Photobacterium aquae TaxID=1195763 RepID=A0A0J1GWH9_9GAMM|nr:PPC domain-containing DNA-binding protein [Photobacterium aquae]KLV03764.1 DNA-binding protein [Photobacterium aquae]
MLTPHAFRLTQGDDLKQAVLAYIQGHHILAGSLISGVGCLSAAEIRLANEKNEITLSGPLEILTLSGTLTPEHVHLHISVADAEGKVTGGHLMDGCIVSYTAEICLVEYGNMVFSREVDLATGFTELVIDKRR